MVVAYLCMAAICAATAHAGGMGKATLVFDHAEPCTEKLPHAWNHSVKTSKLSRTKTQLTIYLDAKEPIDETFKLDNIISIWSNGGWKPNFYRVVVNDICNTLRVHVRKTLVQLATDSHIPVACPLPAGPILLKNHVVDGRNYIKQAVLPYGKFRATSYFVRGKKRVACLNSYTDIVPSN